MKNAGILNLGDLALTTAVTDQVITSASNAQGATQAFVGGLQGMQSVTLSAEVLGGTGGSTVDVKVQTSLNQGRTWIDIARFAFTGAGAKACNLTGAVSKAIASYDTLDSEGVNDGILGDRLRAVVTSTGTFSDTTVSVRASAR